MDKESQQRNRHREWGRRWKGAELRPCGGNSESSWGLHLDSAGLVPEKEEVFFFSQSFRKKESATGSEFGHWFIYLAHIKLFQRAGRWLPTKQSRFQPSWDLPSMGDTDNKKRQMKVQFMINDVKMMKWQRPRE